MFADGRIVSILKLLWCCALENFNDYFGIASLPIFLTLVLGVCVRFKLKIIYISKR
jgi:hypothetical protein